MIKIAGFQALSCKLRIPFVGVWVAELHVDGNLLPSGKVTIEIEDQKLIGTVNAARSSVVGEHMAITVEGGGGGWSKSLPAQHFHNDAGVRWSNVITVTAAQAGETIGTNATGQTGVDFTRTEGEASRAFHDRPWYVDDNGITQAQSRPAVKAPDTIEITAIDGKDLFLTVTAIEILRPGMVLSTEYYGSLVVQDVEQTFDGGGCTAKLWCSRAPVARKNGLFEGIGALAREATGSVFLSPKRYRITSQAADGRLILSAYAPTAGVPDVVAIAPWPGFQGLSGRLSPGAIVLVEFVEGDPSLPIVRSFATGDPIELWLSASAQVKIAAPQVVINGGVMGAARMGDAVQAGPWSGTIVAASATTRIG